jgi:uncharacterized protein YidB (DUF937 family)
MLSLSDADNGFRQWHFINFDAYRLDILIDDSSVIVDQPATQNNAKQLLRFVIKSKSNKAENSVHWLFYTFRKDFIMGLFDQILSATGGLSDQQGEGGSSPLGAILQLVNNPQTGGISGILQSFEAGGLGEVVKSWVSTGQNLPITADQIQSVIGSEQIQNIANRLGVDPAQASAQIAEYLPQVIDKLTPNGTLPEGGDLLAQGMNLLKGKFFA